MRLLANTHEQQVPSDRAIEPIQQGEKRAKKAKAENTPQQQLEVTYVYSMSSSIVSSMTVIAKLIANQVYPGQQH